MIAVACLLLTAGLLIYVFSPARLDLGEVKSRAAYLRERKEAVYENLRDLNFEYKAGKLSDSDYQDLHESLENEAAGILAELSRLESVGA